MKSKYSTEVVALVLFNLIFVITGLVFIPILAISALAKNVTLGIFTGIDAILFLLIVLKPEKMNKASGALLLFSFAAVFTVVFKWAKGLI